MKKKFFPKWKILIKSLPILLIIILIKIVVHYFDYEIMELNALFTSLVGATIFLIGFLISGVLSDYKESEKIPNEITSSLKNILDDSVTLKLHISLSNFNNFIAFQKDLANDIKLWLYKEITTNDILKKIDSFNTIIVQLDKDGVQANYIIRMKNEMGNIRKTLLRIECIRDTDFILSAYAIVEAMAFIIIAGLISIKMDQFFVAIFFTVLVSFLFMYMILLIKDLDDPFDYATNSESGTEISLSVFHEHINFINSNY